MVKTIGFLIGIALIVVVGFVYLNTRPLELPSSLEDATTAERCARFRTTDTEDNVYSLGYGGRIRQLLHGCF